MKYDLRFMNKTNMGFTLFELLVSISIIAILIALASASYGAAQKKARDARRMEDMENVRKAAEQYYMLNSGSYPTTGWSAGSSWVVSGQTVLAAFPKDPKPVPYTQYNPTTTTTSAYCLCAKLENSTGNSNVTTCAAGTWLSGTGAYYCVVNQQ